MISVIIPTYNRLALLKTTLDNLFRQSQPAGEIIVVDDHSTDGTYEYLKNELSDKVIALQRNGKGPGAARNTGLKAATGQYIKFFDSDDVTSLNTLEVQSQLLRETSEPMVYSPYVQARFEDGKWVQHDVVLQHTPIPQTKSLRHCMALGFFTVIPGMMFDRNFLKEVGDWREDIVAYEDWDFLWRISKHVSNPLHTNECAMIYRIHGKQTTENNFNNHQRDLNKISCLQEIIKKEQLPYFQKQLLQAELAHTIALTESTQTTIPNKLLLLYKRIRNKTERLLTHSNWERMHGPCADPKVFEHYIGML